MTIFALMKRQLFLALLLACGLTHVRAQHVRFGPLHSADSPREDWILPGDTLVQDGHPMVYGGKPVKADYESSLADKKENPTTDIAYGWGLHEGLNVSLGLNAFVTSGKHVPHRGGFGQNLSLSYLTPLTKDRKLWLNVGGSLNHTTWGGDSYRDGSVYAMLGYRFNDRWEAYIYGQLSLCNNYDQLYSRYYGYGPCSLGYGPYALGMSWGGYGLMNGAMGFGGIPGANVVGAGVKYNVNRNFSIGFNIEGVWYNNSSTPSYNRKGDYPLPSATGSRD